MTFCKKCGTEIKDGVKFCPKCGTMVNSMQQDLHPQIIESQSDVIETEVISAPAEPIMTHINTSDSYSSKRKGYGKAIAVFAVIAIVVIAAVILTAPTKYDLNISTNGSGSVYGSGTYESGEIVTIKAVGSNGMEFYKWSDGSTSATRTVTMTGDMDLVAYFANFYDINLKVSNSEYGHVSGAGHIKQGDSIVIKATPNYGYRFVSWTLNGSVVSTNESYSFKASSNATYTANFEPLTFKISTSINNSSWGRYSGGGTFTYLSSVTLSASPYEGYEFLGWYDGSTFCSSSRNYTLQVTADKIYTAKFGIIHDATFYCTQTSALAPSTFTFTSKYNVEIVSSQWSLTNYYGGTVIATYNSPTELTHTASKASYFTVKRTVTYSDGQIDTYTSNCLADYIYTRTVDFRYSDGDWWSTLWGGYSNVATSITISIKWSDYMYYAHKDLNSRTGQQNQAFIQKFVIPSDDVIQQIAKNVEENTSGLTKLQRAQYALNMIQMMVSYQYDIDRKGQRDYFGYAVETLYEGRGDCDDSAILYANVMKALGYPTALCWLTYSAGSAHLCAMVAVPGADGYGLTINGTNYYFAEATDDKGNNMFKRRDIGDKPNGFSSWDTTQYKVYMV